MRYAKHYLPHREVRIPAELFCVIGMKFPITQEMPVSPPAPASRAALRVVS